jgi:hypothetical protein
LTWEQITGPLRDIEQIQDAMWGFDSALEDIERRTGISIEEDLLSQATGEYALAVVPDSGGLPAEPEVPLGLVLMAEVERAGTMRDALDDFAERLAGSGLVAAWPQESRGITTLDTGEGWTLAYGFVDDFLVIGSSPAAVEAALEGEDDPLADSRLMQAAMSPLPSDARAFMFADIQTLISAISRAGDDDEQEYYERELEPYLAPVEAVSLGIGLLADDRLVRGTLFVKVD